ncbi:hypothetical protein [Phenylobacterium deserti]|uniref:Uncharacterized protein n=1 Tax=Phenylobacterium deserti TaxID=1914756 RepID=A0A328ASV4_9CAUL|nr:hypothetical protein [Phenylobacterium deserti]RAK58080.1 hypothetical protein DJ018_09280 [Phenylobacterium deserti]
MSENRNANRSRPDHEDASEDAVDAGPLGDGETESGLGAEGDTATGATGSTTGAGASQVGAGLGGSRP